ncbi:MAG: hypothetical protein KF797_07360 [Flavobacteriales bacterium]|nr:hypothetical protein [Flavobacteriales bacterium]
MSFTYDERQRLVQTKAMSTLHDQQYNEVTEFYPSGSVRSRHFEIVESKRFAGVFRLDSTYTQYYPEGQVKRIARYEKGQLNGNTTGHYPSGSLSSIMVYEEGRLLSVRYFDQDGIELDHGEFRDGNGWLAVHENGVKVSVSSGMGVL